MFGMLSTYRPLQWRLLLLLAMLAVCVGGSSGVRGAVISDCSLWTRRGRAEVSYKLGDSTIDDAAIREGIAYYEEHTCIKFTEVGFLYWSPHVVFRASADTCSSYRCMREDWASMFFGQDVLMTQECSQDSNKVLHQMADFLGLVHEQSRSDRDFYVTLMTANIMTDKLGNFNREGFSVSFGAPYDYTSIMQLSPFAYSSNGESTMYATNPFYQGLMMTPRTGLSFTDKLALNTAYGCIEQWQQDCGFVSRCENLGYLAADCSCVCPEGTTGTLCEEKTMEYTDALSNTLLPQNGDVTEEGELGTVGYPSPQTDGAIFTKVITAPTCKRVILTVTGFSMAPRCADQTCCDEGLEVRLDPGPNTSSSNHWYCGAELTEAAEIVSDVSSLVLFYARQSNPDNDKASFSFSVSFQDIVGCT